jgi:hypothetical protein
MKPMIRSRRGRRGQALLLVTLSLFAMCGLLGLAVDLGWSYFIKKSAQNAADSAALADAYQVLSSVGETANTSGYSGTPSVGPGYAQPNSFTAGGNGGRQNVTFTYPGTVTRQDGTAVPSCTGSPGSVGCVEYAVTVRTAEAIPQLFSAILGNASALSSARATAAVVQVRVNGSLITLNRAADNFGPNAAGIDVSPSPITATSGLIVAGGIQSSTIFGPIIALSSVANPHTGSSFQNMVDGPLFIDPLRGYGQPPLPVSALNTFAVIGGDMTGSAGGIFQCSSGPGPCQINLNANLATGGSPILKSGNYFPAGSLSGANCAGNTCTVALGGGQLTIGNNTVTFSDSSPFGYYFLYGGLRVSGGKMVMGPGEYVFVGDGPPIGTSDDLFTSSTAEIDGAGAILIFTGASGPFTGTPTNAIGPADLYPNLITQVNSSADLIAMADGGQLAFGPVSLSTGPTGNVTGLDPASSALPQNLVPFGGLVMWQDQANSGVVYTTPANTPTNLPGSGYIDIFNCGSRTMANPCTKTLQNPNSPGINVQTQYALGFNGTIYQPRGAWINVGPGTLGGAMQVITGSVAGNPGSAVSLQPPTVPLRRRVVALIE